MSYSWGSARCCRSASPTAARCCITFDARHAQTSRRSTTTPAAPGPISKKRTYASRMSTSPHSGRTARSVAFVSQLLTVANRDGDALEIGVSFELREKLPHFRGVRDHVVGDQQSAGPQQAQHVLQVLEIAWS